MKNASWLVVALVSLSFIPIPSPAEPPPWAPAHGWRKKNDPNYVGYTGKRWEKDYGVIGGHCNTAEVGAVLGAVIGAKVGQSIDDADRACMGHALELAGRSKTVAWTNQATGLTYRLTPTRDFGDARQPCREFRTVVSSGKKQETVTGTACRRGHGDWVFKS